MVHIILLLMWAEYLTVKVFQGLIVIQLHLLHGIGERDAWVDRGNWFGSGLLFKCGVWCGSGLNLCCHFSLHLFFIIPDTWEGPYLNFLIFGTSDELLLIFKPEHLCDCSTWMRLQDIYGVTVFGRPYCYIAILISSYDLSILIPPCNKTAIGFALECCNLFWESLPFRPAKFKYR